MSIQMKSYGRNYKINFQGTEEERFWNFLSSTGRKAGPYLRILALREIESWENSTSNPENSAGNPL